MGPLHFLRPQAYLTPAFPDSIPISVCDREQNDRRQLTAEVVSESDRKRRNGNFAILGVHYRMICALIAIVGIIQKPSGKGQRENDAINHFRQVKLSAERRTLTEALDSALNDVFILCTGIESGSDGFDDRLPGKLEHLPIKGSDIRGDGFP